MSSSWSSSDPSSMTSDDDHARLYSILNLSPHASLADVQKSYKLLSLSFHPDKAHVVREYNDASDDDDDDRMNDAAITTLADTDTALTARDAFQQVRLAHEVLSDSLLRFCYDQAGIPGVVLVGLMQQQVDQHKNMEPKNMEHDNENINTDNYYLQLRRYHVTNPDRAALLLKCLLQERLLAAAASRSNESMEVSVEMPITIDQLYAAAEHDFYAAPIMDVAPAADSQLAFTSRQSLSQTCQTTIGTVCRVSPTGTATMQTMVGLDAMLGAATQVAATVGVSPKVMPLVSPLINSKRQEQGRVDASVDAAREGSINVKQLQQKRRRILQQSTSPPIQVALRTSRTFANGTVTMLALQTSLVRVATSDSDTATTATKPDAAGAGEATFKSTFSSLRPASTLISVTSLRNICYSSLYSRSSSSSNDKSGAAASESNKRKLQACWKMALQPVRRRQSLVPNITLAQLMVSLQNLVFPKYRMQVTTMSSDSGCLGGALIKLKCTSHANHGLRGSLSLVNGLWLNGCKCTWLTKPLSLGRNVSLSPSPTPWQLQYGLKCSNASQGLLPWQWTIVCQLQGSIWNFKIPILLNGASVETPILCMTFLLVRQFVDNHLLPQLALFTKSKQKHKRFVPDATSEFSIFGGDNTFLKEIIQRTAMRKRKDEASIDGLVILEATSSSTSAVYSEKTAIKPSWTDILQFWVADSRLELESDRLEWMFPHAHDDMNNDDALPLWKRVWNRISHVNEAPLRPTLELTIRYSYHGRVYETRTSGSRVYLPTPAATCLGPVERIK
ncbi:hypothetical protein MPSEU_000673500 [Mayamaea pseudoterrestris]|nr:hypothetical protein MPSEU_000673500 [Mayamaea pseudoterrestris]